MYFIGLSGPPRSGKDTIGALLEAELLTRNHHLRIDKLSLSMPMRWMVYELANEEYSLDHYEANKDSPNELLGGATIRQAMIDLSEKHIKPQYGQDYWARHGIHRLLRRGNVPNVIVCTDVGFDSERQFFEKYVGGFNCLWVQVQRDGTSFANDSRGYIKGQSNCTVPNNQDGYPGIREAANMVIARAQNLGWTI